MKQALILLALLSSVACTATNRVTYDMGVEPKGSHTEFRHGATMQGGKRDFRYGLSINGAVPRAVENDGAASIPIVGSAEYESEGKHYSFRLQPFMGVSLLAHKFGRRHGLELIVGTEVPLKMDIDSSTYTFNGTKIDQSVPDFEFDVDVGGYADFYYDLGPVTLGMSGHLDSGLDGGVTWRAGVNF